MNPILIRLQQRQAAEALAAATAVAQQNAVVVDPLIGAGALPPDSVIATPPELPPPPPKGPPGSYRSLNLKRFFLPSGQKIEPNDEGFYIPQSEAEVKELEYFATQYDMVELQVEDPAP